MNRRIFNFELDGKTVLGFDTGLNAQAFAQARIARYITSPGTIVYPDGKTENWQPGGTVEYESTSTIVIWGSNFPGEELLELINDDNRKEEALNALRYWLKARMIAEEKNPAESDAPFPGPKGAFFVSKEKQETYPMGTVFLPPIWLLKRTLEADGAEAKLEAERWTHPDLEGSKSISFSAGAMLYRILSGAPPFPRETEAELRQDIREAVFIPPNLASPGIDPEMSDLIARSMCRVAQDAEAGIRPSPDFINGFIGPPGSKPVSGWRRSLNEEEISKIRAEHEQYSKRSALKVKTRRFVIRNTAIIAGSAIIAIILILSVRSFVRGRADLPTTKGMTPIEVAEAYYGAFDDLNHVLMEACVIGKAGKQDITMIMNFFVITKVRQAYEYGEGLMIRAQEWIDSGRPEIDRTVFGITDFSVRVLSEDGKNANLEVNYILWAPGSDTGDEEMTIQQVSGRVTKDYLTLTFQKDAWRIAEIIRN